MPRVAAQVRMKWGVSLTYSSVARTECQFVLLLVCGVVLSVTRLLRLTRAVSPVVDTNAPSICTAVPKTEVLGFVFVAWPFVCVAFFCGACVLVCSFAARLCVCVAFFCGACLPRLLVCGLAVCAWLSLRACVPCLLVCPLEVCSRA